ncbi:hypothetical protein [Lelliottia amnigena]|uniref:hypothetical protein n=1 Tax=Lelliottia amnigena TaxID=61646 RepID=UPI001F0DB41A|nr:hypothetical protein [Lelliottia amnigena]
MSTNKQALREEELLELNELLRGKVKQLEEKIWDTDQLRKVHSEKSFELEGKVRELEARNQKDFVWRGQEIGRLNDEVDELKEKLQAAEKRIADLGGHLKSAHAFIENTEAFGYEAASGILKCGDSEWNVDASKEALAAAGITVKGE